jgi:hypothetical protein
MYIDDTRGKNRPPLANNRIQSPANRCPNRWRFIRQPILFDYTTLYPYSSSFFISAATFAIFSAAMYLASLSA